VSGGRGAARAVRCHGCQGSFGAGGAGEAYPSTRGGTRGCSAGCTGGYGTPGGSYGCGSQGGTDEAPCYGSPHPGASSPRGHVSTPASQAEERILRARALRAGDWSELEDVLARAQAGFERRLLTAEQVERVAEACTVRSRQVPEHRTG